jgi:hypothetical protein
MSALRAKSGHAPRRLPQIGDEGNYANGPVIPCFNPKHLDAQYLRQCGAATGNPQPLGAGRHRRIEIGWTAWFAVLLSIFLAALQVMYPTRLRPQQPNERVLWPHQHAKLSQLAGGSRRQEP